MSVARTIDMRTGETFDLPDDRSPSPATLDDVRSQRSTRRYPGRLATGLGFDADLRNSEDETNVHGLGLMGTAEKLNGETGAVIFFRDADNHDHWLTPEQAIALGKRLGRYKTDLTRAKGAVDAQVAAGTITTLEQIRDAPNWPDPMVVQPMD